MGSEAKPWDIARFIFSLALLVFSGVVTCYSIIEQKTGMWKEVPGWASLLIFIFCLWLLGVMEGLQIALVELKRQNPDTYKDQYQTAYKLGQMASQGDNIEKFLMGRQVFVVCLVFFSAKLTTIHSKGEFLFDVPDWVHLPGDWSPGLCCGGDRGPADASDCCFSLPGPVPRAGGHEASLLCLHHPRVHWNHPLLLGSCCRFGICLQNEEGARRDCCQDLHQWRGQNLRQ